MSFLKVYHGLAIKARKSCTVTLQCQVIRGFRPSILPIRAKIKSWLPMGKDGAIMDVSNQELKRNP